MSSKISKPKKIFACQNCGYEAPKWVGKCPACNEWNTIVEETIYANQPTAPSGFDSNPQTNSPKTIDEIIFSEEERFSVDEDEELNRVLGGGIVKGSVILLSGEPGIGKSTLVLQLMLGLKDKKVLYVSGEESLQQIKLRSERIQKNVNSDCHIMTETVVQNLYPILGKLKPDLVIVDSVQTIETLRIDSPAGSVSQIRESVAELIKYAKKESVALILIGHITKDGFIAGPKILEHMVDVVLKFEGDRKHLYRILRPLKNRFGATSEIGIYEMLREGMKGIKNPFGFMNEERQNTISGISITCALEGYRALLVEAQALVSKSPYSTPQRSATGFDNKRLGMLLAIIEKRLGLFLGNQDVFVNITGGVKIEDTGFDLGVMCAILSSYYDMSIPNSVCFAGELSLSGEIVNVGGIEQRINEAQRMGFEKIFIPQYGNKHFKDSQFNIEIVGINNVPELATKVFGRLKNASQ